MATEPHDTDYLTLAEVYLVPSRDGGLTLRSPRRSAVLRGKLVTEIFPRLLPLLDGTRTAGDLVAALQDQGDATQLAMGIAKLQELGVIEPAYRPDDVSSPDMRERFGSQHRFFRQYGGDEQTMTRIAGGTVLLAGDGPLLPAAAFSLAASGVHCLKVAGSRAVDDTDVAQSAHVHLADVGRRWAEVVQEVLKRNGLDTDVTGADFGENKLDWQQQLTGVDCAVLALGSPVVSLPWIGEFNKASIAARTPWTSGSLLQRAVVHVGPSILPGETACWKCFEYRFKSNLTAVGRYEEFQDYVAATPRSLDQGSVPGIAEFTGALVAFEALRILGAGDLYVRSAGVLLTLDLWELRMDAHPVLKLPRCPHCSSVSSVPQERLWS